VPHVPALQDEARYISLKRWLQSNAELIKGVHLPSRCWAELDSALVQDLVLSIASAAAAAAGSDASAAGACAAEAAGQAAPVVPLEYLHLASVHLEMPLVNTLALCTQLQVLVLEVCWATRVWLSDCFSDTGAAKQLLQHVFPRLGQLRQLSWGIDVNYDVTGDELFADYRPASGRWS
jgi:hypothetical protein